MLTRMARLLTRMARMLTRMTRWLAGSHIIHTITDISCPIVSRGASSKYRPILGRYICRPLYRPISRSTLPTVNIPCDIKTVYMLY